MKGTLHSIVLSKEGKFLFEQSSNKRLSSLPCSFFQDDALCPLPLANLPLKIYSKKMKRKKREPTKQTNKTSKTVPFTSVHLNIISKMELQTLKSSRSCRPADDVLYDRGPGHPSRYSLARLFAKSGSLRQKFFFSLVFLTMMAVTNSILAVCFHQELSPISLWQATAPASIPSR